MITLTNVSHGNLMIDSMAVMLVPGQQLELPGTWSDNLMLYPELSLFYQRERIVVKELSPEVRVKEE